MNFRIFLLVFLFFSQGLSAQRSPQDSCKGLLMDFVRSMAKIGTPDAKKIYHLNYKIETVYKPASNNPNSSMQGNYLLSGEKTLFESNVMSAYADGKNGFLILHNQRKIIWGPGGKNIYGKENFDRIAGFQDTLVKFSSLTSCRNITENNEPFKEIVLETNDNIKRVFHVSSIQIKYDMKANRISRVICHYDKESKIERMSVTYNDLDFDYTGPFFSSAYSKVLTSGGKLKSIYKGYELIDNRQTN